MTMAYVFMISPPLSLFDERPAAKRPSTVAEGRERPCVLAGESEWGRAGGDKHGGTKADVMAPLLPEIGDADCCLAV